MTTNATATATARATVRWLVGFTSYHSPVGEGSGIRLLRLGKEEPLQRQILLFAL
jgi:hypothetical protein